MIPDSRAGSWESWHDSADPPRIGVSKCLQGELVRHDGGHTRDAFVVDVLAPFVEFTSVCPELAVGMGVPRPTIRIIQQEGVQHLIAPSTGKDWTDEMRQYGHDQAQVYRDMGLDGFMLKKGSPSCGLFRIKIYNGTEKGASVERRNARGLFADTVLDEIPDLAAEEEGRMNDPAIREDFVERIFAISRLRRLLANKPSRHDLVQFHTAHKSMLFTRHEQKSRELGAYLGQPGEHAHEDFVAGYAEAFRSIFTHRSTVGRHVNVLHHAMGHIKRMLDSEQKKVLLSRIEDYREGQQPRSIALTLISFLAQTHKVDYLLGQLYFDPCPRELLPGDRLQRKWLQSKALATDGDDADE
jgi:uncharacterized protein YbgA (DUF1722 family)/uncharacterized protein YbbK (DUF523 family)